MLTEEEKQISELLLAADIMEKRLSTLSKQLQSMEKVSAQLEKENNELKISVDSAQKIYWMKEVITEKTITEIEHLKMLATAYFSDTHVQNGLPNQQMNSHIVRSQQLQMQEQPSQPQQTQPEQFDT